MKKIFVSACLLGFNVKYNGKNNKNDNIIALKNDYILIPICPEKEGGLGCPRTPSEIKNGKVYFKTGEDVTDNFSKGAEKIFELAKKEQPDAFILKEGSPSCGVNLIYDGNFTNTKIKGQGITVKKLQSEFNNFYSENEIEKFKDEIKKL